MLLFSWWSALPFWRTFTARPYLDDKIVSAVANWLDSNCIAVLRWRASVITRPPTFKLPIVIIVVVAAVAALVVSITTTRSALIQLAWGRVPSVGFLFIPRIGRISVVELWTASYGLAVILLGSLVPIVSIVIAGVVARRIVVAIWRALNSWLLLASIIVTDVCIAIVGHSHGWSATSIILIRSALLWVKAAIVVSRASVWTWTSRLSRWIVPTFVISIESSFVVGLTFVCVRSSQLFSSIVLRMTVVVPRWGSRRLTLVQIVALGWRTLGGLEVTGRRPRPLMFSQAVVVVLSAAAAEI